MYKKFKEWVNIREDLTPTPSTAPASPKTQMNNANTLSKMQTAVPATPQNRAVLNTAKQQFAKVASDPQQAVQMAQTAKDLRMMKK
jgi:hypothetical protein